MEIKRKFVFIVTVSNNIMEMMQNLITANNRFNDAKPAIKKQELLDEIKRIKKSIH